MPLYQGAENLHSLGPNTKCLTQASFKGDNSNGEYCTNTFMTQMINSFVNITISVLDAGVCQISRLESCKALNFRNQLTEL